MNVPFRFLSQNLLGSAFGVDEGMIRRWRTKTIARYLFSLVYNEVTKPVLHVPDTMIFCLRLRQPNTKD